MFCGKCGAENENNAVFCCNCGEKIQQEQERDFVSAYQRPKSKKKKKSKKKYMIIGITFVTAIVALAAFIIYKLIFGGGYRKVFDNFCDYLQEGNGKTCIEIMPPEYVEYLEDEMGISEKQLIKKATREDNDGYWSEYGDEVKVSYKIKKVKNVKKSEIKKIVKKYKKSDIDIDIQDAKKVKVFLTVESKEVDLTLKGNITVIKEDGKWYINVLNDDETFGNLFSNYFSDYDY